MKGQFDELHITARRVYEKGHIISIPGDPNGRLAPRKL
jgi:hypothetical protein